VKPPPQEYHTARDLVDRTAWIKVAGALVTCFGVFLLLSVPLALGAQLLAPGQAGLGDKIAGLGAVVFVTLPFAGATLWVGIGLIRVQRWAYHVATAACCLALAFGLVAVVVMAVTVPTAMEEAMAQQAAGAPPMPRAVLKVTAWATVGCSGLLYLGAPGLLLLVFAMDSVERTVDRHDPGPAWTDACPLPVLGVAMASLVIGAGHVGPALQGYATVFGEVVWGPGATLLGLGLVAAGGLLAYGAFRLRPWAWAGLLLFFGGLGASAVATAALTTTAAWEEVFRRLGIPEDQLALVAGPARLGVLSQGVPALGLAAFTLWLAPRFFGPGDPEAEPGEAPL